MQATTLKLYSLSYRQTRTYLFATLFVIGNILLPQLCHLIPQGGLIFLPIYFFTLIAGFKYGWKVGLLTAIFSPIVNNLLFGMPVNAMLPAILTKSIFLAVAAAAAAHYFNRINFLIIALVVLAYQVFGTLVEWAIAGNFFDAVQDFRIGLPGMLVQIVAGTLVIKYLLRN
jgi:thiamine transporter ThiT